MRKVLLTIKLSEPHLKLFDGIDDLELVTVLDGEIVSFNQHIRDAEAVLLTMQYKVTRDMIESAEYLKVISRYGVGVDNIDVNAATEHGIFVLNTPKANSVSVAEHAVSLIAAISKQLVLYDREMRDGNYQIRWSKRSVDIQGKTLGLIGCGRIGQMVAQKCKAAFGMGVIGFDPHIVQPNGITLCNDIEEVFKRADYISLHLPLTDSTRNLVGERLLSLVKPNAYIVNTARGGILDEHVLAKKLKNNEVAGAAIDVTASEPPDNNNPLLGLDNVILTPHTAAMTKECSARVTYEATVGIVDCLKGIVPQYVLNKELVT